MIRLSFVSIPAAACFAGLAFSAFAAEEASYNMPDSVTTTMDADAVMKKMETAVKPEVLEAFKKQHPGKFWLFGEDRQFAIRKNVVPAHWFENGAKQFQQFSGVARPGEFYVFQVCVIPGEQTNPLDCGVVFDSLKGAEPKVISGTDYGNARKGERRLFFDPVKNGEVVRDPVKPIWIGLQIPENAEPGNYAGKVLFRNSIFPSESGEDKHLPYKEQLAFSIKVEGDPIKESGVDDAWRLARLKWLDSKIGNSDTQVTRPFSPVKVNESARSLEILGRRIKLGSTGIPEQFTSYFSGSNTKILTKGRDAFAKPAGLECIVGGKAIPWKTERFEWQTKPAPAPWKTELTTPVAARWNASSSGGGMILDVRGVLEFDGNLKLEMKLHAKREPISVEDVRFVAPWNNDVAKYAMGLGLQGGLCPAKLDWKWDVKKHQDAIWMGDANIGAMLRFKDGRNYHRPLINAYYDFSPLSLPESWGTGGVRIEKGESATTLTAHSGPKQVTPLMKGDGGFSFDIDWYLTPFKPLDVKKHFTDRYYHAKQGAPIEDTAKLKAEGANIVEIHHNRLCNPYINYPFNDDSFGHLKDFVKKAHADDMRVNLYYTTRELTQNLPEFFALKSMAGEIILPRKEGVAWPVTNSGGPHPWLKEHVGEDIVPAWRENLKFPEYQQKLDLAVITTPDSRWNNFYLEGLNYLIKKAGIDGLYIDDTALDRKSMQRARRILDADGNTGRRVSMHSWNHFNGLAKWSNSSIAFMELYPYYDGLWHGESFNANSSPEFMLVEMSGIPYGLMSEMLDHPNAWHGMVFGMRTRWPWSGDPRNIWKLEDQFGIADSEYLGWWDPACPVKTDNPQVKASVYRKDGKTLIALGSWAPTKTMVKLAVDWKALGLSPAKTTLCAPACDKFQSEMVFAADAAIPVEPGKGWLLIADEQARQVSRKDISNDPLRGKPALGGTETPFDIRVPANTVATKDLAWMSGATAVAARLDPMEDEGQSWGVGLAVGWADGKYVHVHMRTDGRWGIRHNGTEMLTGTHAKGKPAVVAVWLGETTVRIMAKEDVGADWEALAEFPRGDFAGAPASVRYGKIGQSWKAADFSDKGGIRPCRVEWIRFH